MADKKPPAAEEKIFTIPLRREYLLATRVQRTKKTVIGVKKYVLKHTHASEVKISQKLNDSLWTSGAKKPLRSIKVKVSVSEGIANTRLPEEITLEEEKQKFLAEKDKKKGEVKAEEKPAEEVKTIPEESPKTEKEPKADLPLDAEPAEKK